MIRIKASGRSKYRAVRTSCGRHEHASKREAVRCGKLQELLAIGEIRDLIQQPNFGIYIKGKHICDYIADFGYVEKGKTIFEDCKGMRTPIYRLKKKMVEAEYGIQIRET